MAPSSGGLLSGHFPQKWGGGPSTKHSETKRAKKTTRGSYVRRRETGKASQVRSIEILEKEDLFEGLQVIKGRQVVSGAPEHWFRRLYKELNREGLRLEQFPKLKFWREVGDSLCRRDLSAP